MITDAVYVPHTDQPPEWKDPKLREEYPDSFPG